MVRHGTTGGNGKNEEENESLVWEWRVLLVLNVKSIAIIPARSGSKGLKDKNIKELCGKPLLAYSIECALDSQKFDKIFVSTDSPEYACIAEKYGADASFLRTEANSSDVASSWNVVREVVECFERQNERYDSIMLLQPTSPLRSAEDINNCFELMKEREAFSILSVTEVEHSPLWCNTLDADLCMDHFIDEKYIDVPRQKLPIFYRLNGAIYLLKRHELDKKMMFRERCYAYVMPNDRSVDIDSELDFKITEYLLERGRQNNN